MRFWLRWQRLFTWPPSRRLRSGAAAAEEWAVAWEPVGAWAPEEWAAEWAAAVVWARPEWAAAATATPANKVRNPKRLTPRSQPTRCFSSTPDLESKLASLLPQGTNIQQAASGFKNLGQFVAAVHVSHNLGIPFDQLKSTMLGPPSESLGKAIHTLKPDAASKPEVKKAEEQTKQDLTQPEANNDKS